MPRPRGWVWEHYETKTDSRGRQLTACLYCDSSLAGRGNPIRMTRHLALYCLAVPEPVKARAARAVTKPPTTSPSAPNQPSAAVDDDIKMEDDDRVDPGGGAGAFRPSQHPQHGDNTRIATLSPIQSLGDPPPLLAEKEDGLLLSQYLAPTKDELLARALVSTRLNADAVASPEWRDFFAAVGYTLPPQSAVERLMAAPSPHLR